MRTNEQPGSGFGGLDAITIDCADPIALGRFWAQVFGAGMDSPARDAPQYVDLPSAPGVPTLRFQRVPEPKTELKNRLHMDVSVEDLDESCARVEAIGGRRLSPEPFTEYGYRWLVMADPEGNEFCLVVPPGAR